MKNIPEQMFYRLTLGAMRPVVPVLAAALLMASASSTTQAQSAGAHSRGTDVIATPPGQRPANHSPKPSNAISQSRVAPMRSPEPPVGGWSRGENRPPYAITDSFVTTENEPLAMAAPGMLGNDFDLDGDSLRLLSASQPENGMYTSLVTNGQFTYEPDPGFVGIEALTYAMEDTPGNRVEGVWFIEVLPDPNRPPIGIADYFATVVNTPLVVGAPGILANDVDPDGDAIALNSAGGLAHGHFTGLVTNGSFTYRPDPGFAGSDSFTYMLRDADGLTAQGVTFIQVIDPFGPPPADSDMDAVLDINDNCTLVPNGGQRDTDSDGIGNYCDPDLSGDCVVNFTDLGLMKQAIFSDDPHADLDGNGSVNFTDVAIMKQFFFAAPGPSGVPNACSPATLALETFGDFGSPDNGGWTVGTDGDVFPDAGENGLDDHALLYTANSSAHNGFHVLHPGGEFTPNPDFLGDYAAREVTAIYFLARHSGIGDPVTLRVVLFDDFGDGGDWAQTVATVTISPDATSWQSYALSLREVDLVSGGLNGLPVSAIRAAVAQLGLRHDPAGDGPGNPVPVAAPTSVWFDDLTLISEP